MRHKAGRTIRPVAAKTKINTRAADTPRLLAARQAGAITAAIAMCQELEGCYPETAFVSVMQLLPGVHVLPM